MTGQPIPVKNQVGHHPTSIPTEFGGEAASRNEDGVADAASRHAHLKKILTMAFVAILGFFYVRHGQFG